MLAGARSSDHVDEFIERRCQAQVVVPGAHAEFVVATSEVLHEGVSSDHHGCGPITLEAAHRSQACLQSAVVGLNAIVESAWG
jgi:hypothetical protein